MKFKRLITICCSILLILANISCDQITKNSAREKLNYHEKVSVINDKFVLTKVENTGAALSLGENLPPILKSIFLQILPLIVLMFLFRWILVHKDIPILNVVAFSFILGGGIGNIYDRILYDSVTDFMYIEIGFLHTGIFNMADVSVVVGSLLLFLSYFIETLKGRSDLKITF